MTLPSNSKSGKHQKILRSEQPCMNGSENPCLQTALPIGEQTKGYLLVLFTPETSEIVLATVLLLLHLSLSAASDCKKLKITKQSVLKNTAEPIHSV